ncbi:uncharacterized protein LOC62_04G006041 [Vanrija pseudolonga]|uniref:Uncharacterized protein n=1 Tax=Vanrija pseudolonga TaxID=143232 RepID=A0AAF1BJB8_9TREE|nr:hypothetical protein LOC62_04G006041 [Vanrija pseudolonga]
MSYSDEYTLSASSSLLSSSYGSSGSSSSGSLSLCRSASRLATPGRSIPPAQTTTSIVTVNKLLCLCDMIDTRLWRLETEETPPHKPCNCPQCPWNWKLVAGVVPGRERMAVRGVPPHAPCHCPHCMFSRSARAHPERFVPPSQKEEVAARTASRRGSSDSTTSTRSFRSSPRYSPPSPFDKSLALPPTSPTRMSMKVSLADIADTYDTLLDRIEYIEGAYTAPPSHDACDCPHCQSGRAGGPPAGAFASWRPHNPRGQGSRCSQGGRAYYDYRLRQLLARYCEYSTVVSGSLGDPDEDEEVGLELSLGVIDDLDEDEDDDADDEGEGDMAAAARKWHRVGHATTVSRLFVSPLNSPTCTPPTPRMYLAPLAP